MNAGTLQKTIEKAFTPIASKIEALIQAIETLLSEEESDDEEEIPKK